MSSASFCNSHFHKRLRLPSATIGCNQQAARPRIDLAAHLAPPSAQRLDRECRRVMIDADAHPPRIVRQIVNAIRDRLPEILVRKIMNVDSFGPPLALPLLAIILIFSNKFLLFRVNRPAVPTFEKPSHVG